MGGGQVCRAPGSPDQAHSETESVAVVADEPIVTVETNNFREVLEHFDFNGNVIAENTTIFAIPCVICQANNLSLVNPVLNGPTDVPTEHFAVLPNCGHAFGYKCIMHWFLVDEPKCPTCRTPAYCDRGHIEPLEIFGETRYLEAQRRQILMIKVSILWKGCRLCPLVEDINYNVGDTSARNVRTRQLIRAANNGQPSALARALRNVNSLLVEGSYTSRGRDERD
ncbi:hypothetical protein O1611_g5443 [Lasiodiplodia mahajangana]|uniref:Uncharacterized protein n=1 Tax=Lasiodiplodia mahajangana TaxID=1108764 RepID=A0ACC2JL21_9PEZI|nr:hypothetical protein O1611_g5443 [Lasiodiplodia mahajangana]